MFIIESGFFYFIEMTDFVLMTALMQQIGNLDQKMVDLGFVSAILAYEIYQILAFIHFVILQSRAIEKAVCNERLNRYSFLMSVYSKSIQIFFYLKIIHWKRDLLIQQFSISSFFDLFLYLEIKINLICFLE